MDGFKDLIMEWISSESCDDFWLRFTYKAQRRKKAYFVCTKATLKLVSSLLIQSATYLGTSGCCRAFSLCCLLYKVGPHFWPEFQWFWTWFELPPHNFDCIQSIL